MEAIRTCPGVARTETSAWLGDWHPLVRQIAPGEGVARWRSSAPPGPAPSVSDPAALFTFLTHYKSSVLLPFELPAVRQACEHARHNQTQELLGLDRSLLHAPWLKPYQADSLDAGRLHLARLKPLRDQRGLRRYREAVEQGEAHGWHLLVAGTALALYSLPLRQGLMDYALHTLWNAVGQAADPLGLKSNEAAELMRALTADLPNRIQSLLPSRPVTAI
ncbi:MAG: hypothetical protein MUE94_02985 [Verrucomicrobia bacterium]|jgi:urease accessory protein UreF|nr:hypothetical protein [Verrucomicrobiota bacterium]